MIRFFFPKPSERTVWKLLRNIYIVPLIFVFIMFGLFAMPLPQIVQTVIFFGLVTFIAVFWFWNVFQLFKKFFSKEAKDTEEIEKYKTRLWKTSYKVGIIILITMLCIFIPTLVIIFL